MRSSRLPDRVPVVIVGGGQAGLSVGRCLQQRGRALAILDAHARVGDSWRRRWDTLRLFTPAKYDGLVGLPFPGSASRFPTKDEMGDYLEHYAAHFDLPVFTGTTVERVSRRGDRYLVETSRGRIEARHVVAAMATYQAARLPACAAGLSPGIRQIHSREYRNGDQLRPGGVLVVGAGNSGADIALDLAAAHRVWLAGRHPGHVPFRIDSRAARVILPVLFRFLFHRILTVDTRLGRRAREAMISRGGPLIRVKPADLERAGVVRVPRVAGVRDGHPLLADGRVLEVENVVWCTGYEPSLAWVDLPGRRYADDGEPLHDKGIVPGEPGFYFVGLHFLYAFSSTMIHGIARDAERIARTIDARLHEADGTSGDQEIAGAGGQPGRRAGNQDRPHDRPA
ncbi:MAG: NAD(P)-binding domain-containing protein [Acidobacteria bacterium]|nr:NAD(P)-binding domain-containing protein [Acidobacteriota bacterium]